MHALQSIVHDTGTKYCCLPDPDDPEKNTPLHIAARRGHHEVTEVLLRAVPQTVYTYIHDHQFILALTNVLYVFPECTTYAKESKC